MSLLTFNGDTKTWTKGRPAPTHHDDSIDLKNAGTKSCHITIEPSETFGIEYLSLVPGGKIHLPVLKHRETTFSASEIATVAAVAGADLMSGVSPQMRDQPVPMTI